MRNEPSRPEPRSCEGATRAFVWRIRRTSATGGRPGPCWRAGSHTGCSCGCCRRRCSLVGVVGLLATISSESPEARRARCRLRGRRRFDRGPGDATVREGIPLARAARRGPRAVGRSIRREGVEPDSVGRLGVAAGSAHPGPREVPDLLGDLRRADAPPRTPPRAPSGPPRPGCAARAGHSWQGWSR